MLERRAGQWAASYRKARAYLYHWRKTRPRELVQLLAFFLISSSLSTGFSDKQVAGDCQTLRWQLRFGLLWWYALCVSINLIAHTSVSCSFCCSWTQLFLPLSSQALPAALSRSVVMGGCSPPFPPAAYQLLAPQGELLPLTSEGSWPHKTHCFPRSCCILWFLISMLCCPLLVTDNRWLWKL